MTLQYDELFQRNIGILSNAEQKQIKKATIAIAGVGGIGGLLAERLIRLGILHLKICDPESFDLSNFNRQYCATINTLNKNKASSVATQLKKINPLAHITFSRKGIQTQKDAIDFVKGASVVIDEMDYGLFTENIYLHRAARAQKSFYLFSTAIGFGSTITIFDPNGMTLEEFNGFPRNHKISTKNSKLSLQKFCPTIPRYILDRYSQKDINDFLNSKKPGSTNSIGTGLASILTAYETINLILKKSPPVFAPKRIHLDLSARSYL